MEDRFVSGTLETGGERVDLGRIDYRCSCSGPLFLLGPAVPARRRARPHHHAAGAGFAAADYVSTPRR